MRLYLICNFSISVIQMILQESVFITTISGYIGLFLGILVLENIGLTLEEYFIKNPFIDFGTAPFGGKMTIAGRGRFLLGLHNLGLLFMDFFDTDIDQTII